jgi:carboxyl-terminal processing protease
MERLLAELGEVRGLVIDLRVNVGGHDAVALAIASRFTDRERDVFTKDPPGAETGPYTVKLSPAGGKRFTGPVAVLTSHNTVSAGEVLALSLSALPNVTVLGQSTRGAFSDAVPRQLPNGWQYTLAAETYRTIDGGALEGRGLVPDIPTPGPASAAPAALWGRDIGLAVDHIGRAGR